MPDFFLIVGSYCLLLALSGWAIERHETLIQKLSDEAFASDEEDL